MTNFWILSLAIFTLVTFLLAKITLPKFKTETSEKMWKTYGTKTHYWKLLLLCSLGITALFIFILKWTNIIHF
jgi:hypothetical protein